MTEEQIAEAETCLESLKALRALELRLRLPTTVLCYFCGAILLASEHHCDRCGWIVVPKSA